MKIIHHNFRRTKFLRENEPILVEYRGKWKKVTFLKYHVLNYFSSNYVVISAKLYNSDVQAVFSDWKVASGVYTDWIKVRKFGLGYENYLIED